jgi:hypothetical protein
MQHCAQGFNSGIQGLIDLRCYSCQASGNPLCQITGAVMTIVCTWSCFIHSKQWYVQVQENTLLSTHIRTCHLPEVEEVCHF